MHDIHCSQVYLPLHNREAVLSVGTAQTVHSDILQISIEYREI